MARNTDLTRMVDRLKAAGFLGAIFAVAAVVARWLLTGPFGGEPPVSVGLALALGAAAGAVVGAAFPTTTLGGMKTIWRATVAGVTASLFAALSAWAFGAMSGLSGAALGIPASLGAALGAWLGWRYWRVITDSLTLPDLDL